MKLLTTKDAKPCPFCGNENIADKSRIFPTWSEEVQCKEVRVFCRKRGKAGREAAIVRVGPSYEVALDLAILCWNRRTPNE